MRTIPSSELIINDDGSIFHLHLKPEQLADTVLLVGDPARVEMVASYFDSQECRVANREFVTITGTYKGKRMSVISTGIGTDNIDIVVTELDALTNIDFATRQVKPELRQLTLVRLGTSGAIQPDIKVGTAVFYVDVTFFIRFSIQTFARSVILCNQIKDVVQIVFRKLV
ncbi:MAG: hypothetical protein IIU53_02490, partial [Rikenellaceae bacterium]|nr:hypothetical protein [Rikenellaceae bacterium]